MPVSPEAFLISSVIRNQDFTTSVAHGITPEMFRAYRDEWEFIVDYNQRYRKSPTKLAFSRKFPEFKIKVVNDTPHFIDEVRRNHARFLMTTNMREVTELIADGKEGDAVKLMTESMIDISAAMGGVQDIDVLQDWEQVYSDVQGRKERYEEYGMAGIPTGFDTIDERTGGIAPGQFWVWAARLNEGKTWMLMRATATAILAGHNVHFAALEMSKTEAAMRIHNLLSGAVGKQVFRQLDLAQGRDFDIAAYRSFLRNLKKEVAGRLTISDARGIGEVEIAAQCQRHNPDLYVLDYLTLAKTRGDGGWQDIGQFSKACKTIAGDYGVGFLAAAQLNREYGITKGGPAGAEALAQSDAIGQDADAVITQKKMSATVYQQMLAKYRHGPAGYKWWTQMDLDRGIIREVSKNDAQKLMDLDADKADIEADRR